MYFANNNSKEFFYKKIGQVKEADSYIKSLIYVLSNNKDTRENFNQIYDINKNEINIDIFKLPWQTNESINLCRLAMNLYGDINSDNIEKGTNYKYTVTSIFKNIDINIGIQALKIRFFPEFIDIKE